MEHRLQKRQPVRLEVELVKQGQVVGSSCTTDISGGGMGIEPPELELRTGEIVDVNLPRQIPSVPEQHLRTIVVHRESNLIGLMFITNS